MRGEEQQIQKQIFLHLRTRGAPGIFYWHPFSGGYRSPIEAAIFKGLGAIPGLPDVMVLRQGKLFCLELKTADGRVSDNQKDTMAALMAAGAVCAVAFGVDQAIKQLESWDLLRGRAAVRQMSVVA